MALMYANIHGIVSRWNSFAILFSFVSMLTLFDEIVCSGASYRLLPCIRVVGEVLPWAMPCSS